MDAQPLTWKTSAEAMQRWNERLTTPRGAGSLIFPFRALWEYGGFARVVDPGVLIGVVGASGGMKTSFLETITDKWRMADAIDVLWWGIEWSWEKMADRAIQRYGGAPMEAMSLHELWLQEDAKAIPPAARQGVRLTQRQIDDSRKVQQTIASWPGESYQLDQPISDLDRLLKLMAEQIQDVRQTGHHIRVVVFDYLQLVSLVVGKGSESERLSTILERIKLFCLQMQVIGIVTSQVTKTSSADLRDPKKPVILEAESGQNFRSDKFNLVLTLNPVYQGRLITDKGIIYVAKNSTGRTGLQEVQIDPSRFKWIDYDAF